MKTNTKKQYSICINPRKSVLGEKGGKKLAIALTITGCIFFCIAFFVFIGIAPASVLFIGQKSENPNTGTTPGECLSDQVPPNWASVITEAGQKLDVPPAMIAAIYLTEHHSTTFGEDIDVNGREEPCGESYAGAKGPFQLMPGFQRAVEDRADELGLSKPTDVCRYRDGTYGGAIAVKSKMNAARINKGFNDSLSDEEVKQIARRYCGCCACRGCGNSGFDYCDFALERYKEVVGPCS